MRCSKSSNGLRRWAAVAGLLFSLLAGTAHAQGIAIRSASLLPTESGYALEADFAIALTPAVEEALARGLPLHFVTEFEVLYPRWWTFNLWNRTVSEFRTQHRLSFNALTRQFRLSFGNLHQSFDTLDEALALIGRVRYSPAVRYQEVDPGAVYIANLRQWLDTSQLPKPLQINALGSREWNLDSDWYRWTFKP
jgi:hypothetical protein